MCVFLLVNFQSKQTVQHEVIFAIMRRRQLVSDPVALLPSDLCKLVVMLTINSKLRHLLHFNVSLCDQIRARLKFDNKWNQSYQNWQCAISRAFEAGISGRIYEFVTGEW